MPRYFLLTLTILVLSLVHSHTQAQQKDSVVFAHDSTIVLEKKNDTVRKRIYSPRAAAIRSAIVPGLGQIYNKKYWKLPIVYGALGVTAYVFFDNLKTYKEYRFAYKARILATSGVPADSALYYQLKPEYKIYDPNSIRTARDQFRQYIDYSVLVFVVFWGLNVIDAAVDAHLKGFDVSPDLSLKIRPAYIPALNAPGISFVLSMRDRHHK